MKYPLPVGGGGYFRLYPYALTRRGLRAINAAGRPFAVYLHPWEFDPEQPRLRPGMMRAFRHYVGLRRTESRLVRLLNDFRFGTMSESLGRSGCPMLRICRSRLNDTRHKPWVKRMRETSEKRVSFPTSTHSSASRCAS